MAPETTHAVPPTKTELLVISGVKGDTRRYRAFHVIEQLRQVRVPCRYAHITDPDVLERARRASLVLLQRTAFDPQVARLVQNVRARGALAIADVDDLVFDPQAFRWIDSPDFQDRIRAALYKEDMRRHRQTLENCEAALASTEFLAEQVRKIGRPAAVHRNGFSLEMLSLADAAFLNRPPASNRVVLGYASGTPTHDRDFQVVKPALLKILARHESAELWLIGPLNPGSGWGRAAGRLRQIKFVPWRQLPGLLCQFDINLAPLVTGNPFAQSKSEIKFMEAALVRVPTIASPTAAFLHAIEPDQNGLLAATTAEWEEALATLIEDPGLRDDLGHRSYDTVLERYHPRARGRELVESLNQIYAERSAASGQFLPLGAADSASTGPASTALQAGIGTEAERSPSMIRMGLYNLRYRGFGTLLRRIWVYLRRLAAPIFPFRSAAPSADNDLEEL